MIWTAAVILALVPVQTGASDAHLKSPSDDLRCYSAATDMVRIAGNGPEKGPIQSVAFFYFGRLSIIEPSANWTWIAASERHLSPEEALPILKACGDRMASLSHLSEK